MTDFRVSLARAEKLLRYHKAEIEKHTKFLSKLGPMSPRVHFHTEKIRYHNREAEKMRRVLRSFRP